MMYNNKLAVAIKANGKVLREFKDLVYIPFGSEYSILIKNLNTVRVQFRITIDGINVTGDDIIVNQNSELELKRSISNDDLLIGNAFKFIERTAGIEQHRGIGVEDGIVRIEYQFEQANTHSQAWISNEYPQYPHYPQYPYNGLDPVWKQQPNNIMRGLIASNSAQLSVGASTDSAYAMSSSDMLPGITVPGSVVTQHFQKVNAILLESTKHVIVLRLQGEAEMGQPIKTPVTVKQKPKCTSCGRTNKATAKFCSDCGTSLHIV